MNLLNLLKKHWLILFFCGYGIYDFIQGGNWISLISSIFFLLFLIIVLKVNQPRLQTLLGLLIIIFSVFFLVYELIYQESFRIVTLFKALIGITAGLLMFTNKTEQIIAYVSNSKVIITIGGLLIASMVIYTLLLDGDLDFFEIIIVLVALVFAGMLVWPAKKNKD